MANELLLHRLKHDTRELHEQLEGEVDLSWYLADVERYRMLLRLFYGFHRGWEEQLLAQAPADVQSFYLDRRKTPLLESLIATSGLRVVGAEYDLVSGAVDFFAAAAEAMRRILVERARQKNRVVHGGDRRRVELEEGSSLESAPSDDLLALDEALAKLACQEPTKALLVKLRFFAGLSLDEAADTLGISRATAKRHWTYARAWLYSELNPDADDRPS